VTVGIKLVRSHGDGDSFPALISHINRSSLAFFRYTLAASTCVVSSSAIIIYFYDLFIYSFYLFHLLLVSDGIHIMSTNVFNIYCHTQHIFTIVNDMCYMSFMSTGNYTQSSI
jgi:hypothetical protein